MSQAPARPGRPIQTAPDAWVQAALDEIEAGGVRALAVQSVARRLGVSKGGFYHHFADRRELLLAALALWHKRFVVELGARLDEIEDPRERLHVLLTQAVVELRPTVIVQLMAAAGEDADIEAALTRAAQSRIALLARIFGELGFPKAAAKRRAVLTYGVYLGLAQLRTQVPDDVATPAEMRGQVTDLESLLLADIAR